MKNEKRSYSFVLNIGGVPVFKALVDGVVIKADFNCKGAADAAIEVYRKKEVASTNKIHFDFWNNNPKRFTPYSDAD